MIHTVFGSLYAGLMRLEKTFCLFRWKKPKLINARIARSLIVADTISLHALVSFNPPEGAYSEGCLQHQYRGQIGLVKDLWNDSYAYVLFHRKLVLCNTAYLTDTRAAKQEALEWKAWSR